MNQRFDYEKIDVVEFLRSLGVRNVKDLGLEVSYSCPFDGHSRDDNHPSASMTKTTVLKNDGTEYPPTTFNCFTCGRAGTAVSFLAEYEGVSILTARRLIKEKFGMAFREPKDTLLAEIDTVLAKTDGKTIVPPMQPEIDPKELSIRKLEWVNWSRSQGIPPPVTYMLDRGFSPEILDEFQIGWDDVSQRLSIPVFDEMDRLIGFKGRRWDNDQTGEYNPKYLVLGGAKYNFDTYDVSRVLFALSRAKKCIQTYNRMIVVEGELNAISMHQKGFKNTVGISGQYLSPYQRELIAAVSDEVTLYFDEQEKAYRAAEELSRHIMRVKVVPPHDTDAADTDAKDIELLLYGSASPYVLEFNKTP